MLADGSLEHRYQFQWWALDLVGATPQGSVQKKGADKGVDGAHHLHRRGREAGDVHRVRQERRRWIAP